jgi:ribosomal protein L4
VGGAQVTPAAVHGQMAMPRAVHRDEAGELAERERHAAYMEAAWEHARVLMADLAERRRRAALAALN